MSHLEGILFVPMCSLSACCVLYIKDLMSNVLFLKEEQQESLICR